MSSKSKLAKRYKRLISCVKKNDAKRLKYYLERTKYSKLQIKDAVVHEPRQETLLMLACRLSKPKIVQLLLDNGLFERGSRDFKGNNAIHLALKSVLKITEREEFLESK